MEELLRQYNPHWEGQQFSDELIPRSKYTQQITSLLERNEIIVLQGIRRSGKSSLLKLIVKNLIDNKVPPTNILFMNLEDYRFGRERNLNTLDQIFQTYQELNHPQKEVYILLDEIQEIPDFEKWLRTHHEQNKKLKFIITGSSSSLFSQELATLLTGRQIAIEMYPFSFLEFLDFKSPAIPKKIAKQDVDVLYLSPVFGKIEPLLKRYLDEGGFPEIIKYEQSENNILLLQQYISDIILRDIARRYNIRKIEVLQKLALYLIYNMGMGLNISRMAELVGSNRTTILELLAHLKEVYLIFTSSSFSFSPNERMNTTRPKKVYCVDNGFFAAIKTKGSKDFAKKIKNAVYQQLRFRWGAEIFYWKNKIEIDFVLEDGFPIGIVVDKMDTDKEIYRLFYYMNQHNLNKGLLISWNKLQIMEENERKILILPLWLFLTKSQEDVMNYYEAG